MFALKTVNLLFITISLAVCSICSAQQVVEGVVLDDKKRPLAFASVGFIGTAIGTVSNDEGKFILRFDSSQIEVTDSLRVSMIGYGSQTIAKESLTGKIVVQLQEQATEIGAVNIEAKQYNKKTIGHFNVSAINRSCNFSISKYENQNLGSEIGRKFSIGRKPVVLDTFRFYLGRNDFDTVQFRVHVYSIKKGLPDQNLLRKNVIIKLSGGKVGWVAVNLRPYDIQLKGKAVVSIEWIAKSGKGRILALPISMPTFHKHYYKFGSQNSWKSFSTMTTRMELDVLY